MRIERDEEKRMLDASAMAEVPGEKVRDQPVKTTIRMEGDNLQCFGLLFATWRSLLST